MAHIALPLDATQREGAVDVLQVKRERAGAGAGAGAGRASISTKKASLIMGIRMRFTMKPGRSSERLTVLPRCSARPLVAPKTYRKPRALQDARWDAQLPGAALSVLPPHMATTVPKGVGSLQGGCHSRATNCAVPSATSADRKSHCQLREHCVRMLCAHRVAGRDAADDLHQRHDCRGAPRRARYLLMGQGRGTPHMHAQG